MKIQNIHFTGIKGVGMTPLAIIAKEAGLTVTGSDVGEQFITDIALERAGIVPFVGFAPDHVNEAELVVTTGAHGGFDNPEVKSAREKGIRVVSHGEALGLFMEGSILGRKQQGISIAGTHGKTTTTAMVATILKALNLDPSFEIGTSEVASLGSSGHYGTGEFFVAEADEYATEPVHDKRARFLWQHPKMIVFTNIELDHPDIYDSLEQLRSTFLQFARQLPADGVLVACGDDHEVQKVLREFSGRKITYGLTPGNDFVASNVHVEEGITKFTLSGFGTTLGEFSLRVPGQHNVLNSVAAIIVALELGVTVEALKQALETFTGTKRRQEYKGRLESGAILYDDYGHHPTEIKKTLAAIRSLFPDKHIVCIFQPHTYSRTKALYADFIHAFSDADTVLLMDIYASKREQPDPSVSSRLLAEELKKYTKTVEFLPNASDVVEYLNTKQYSDDTVVITMGAGDVYKISEKLKVQS